MTWGGSQAIVPGDTILDPMAGTGSAILAAIVERRNGVGVELNPEFVRIANHLIDHEGGFHLFDGESDKGEVYAGDATKLGLIKEIRGKVFDYCVTSPPYWNMLANPGSEYQAARRLKELPLVYSTNESDLGNISDYDAFLDSLTKVYEDVSDFLKPSRLLKNSQGIVFHTC